MDEHFSKQPLLPDFENATADAISQFAQGKVVLYAAGGTGRWYFLSHGNPTRGYDKSEQFEDYSMRVRNRIVEQVAMMCDDGIKAVLVVALMPTEQTRSEAYNQNLKSSYHLIANDDAMSLYDEHHLTVLFRGGWKSALSQLGASDIVHQYSDLERKSPTHDRRLIWLTPDDNVIPQELASLVGKELDQTGKIPDRASLCNAYYGFPMTHADIFLSNNKPSVKNMIAPLLTLGDLYFTVAPSLFMEKKQWRRILYDHLFARRQYFREYSQLPIEAMNELRTFYSTHQDNVTGVGQFDEQTQTWRPQMSVLPAD